MLTDIFTFYQQKFIKCIFYKIWFARTAGLEDTICEWYKGFKQDCPDGKLSPDAFMKVKFAFQPFQPHPNLFCRSTANASLLAALMTSVIMSSELSTQTETALLTLKSFCSPSMLHPVGLLSRSSTGPSGENPNSVNT